jgi:hypothetical protein
MFDVDDALFALCLGSSSLGKLVHRKTCEGDSGSWLLRFLLLLQLTAWHVVGALGRSSWFSWCGERDTLGHLCARNPGLTLSLRVDPVPWEASGKSGFSSGHAIPRCLLLLTGWSLHDHGLHRTLGSRKSLIVVIVSVSTGHSLLDLCW